MDRKFPIAIAVVTLLILVGGVRLVSTQEMPLMGEEIPIQNATHIQPGESHPDYNSNPPTGGWMYDSVAGAGIHDQEIADEEAVHSLEHGAVIVWYKADLPKDQIDEVKKAYSGGGGKKILALRKNLDVPVALTSWGRLLKLQTIDAGKIKAFIEANNNRGPEKSPMY